MNISLVKFFYKVYSWFKTFSSLLKLQSQQSPVLFLRISIHKLHVFSCSITLLCLSPHNLLLYHNQLKEVLLKTNRSGSQCKYWSIFQIVFWWGHAALLFATVWFCRTTCYRPTEDEYQDVNSPYSYEGCVNLKANNNSSVNPVACQHTRAAARKHIGEWKHLPYPSSSLLRDARSHASRRSWCNAS